MTLLAPTRTGLSFAGLICLLYLSSIQSKSGLLFLIIGILLGCFLVNAVAAIRSVRHFNIVNISAKGIFEGEKTGFWMTIENRSSRPIGMIEAFWDRKATAFKIATVPPLTERRLRVEALFARRGPLRLPELSLSSSFPFGLIRATGVCGSSSELLIYPAVYPCDPPMASGLEQVVGGSRRGRLKTQSGFDFAGVRSYTGDAPLRSVHWKSSAKGLGLMVKEFDEELSGRLTILIDTVAAKTPDGGISLDWAARAAASLAVATLRRGDGVELIDIRQLRIHRAPQLANCEVILNVLACLVETSTPLETSTLQEAIASTPRRSTLCVILTNVSPELLAVLKHLQRIGGVNLFLPEHIPLQKNEVQGLNLYSYNDSSFSRK